MAGRMHRKAEEETDSGALGDDENAARRRPGVEIGGEFVARDTSGRTRWRSDAYRRGFRARARPDARRDPVRLRWRFV